MPKRKLVLKRLTASDLTLFEWQFKNRNAGNQKAINLNRDVFIDKLYPNLPDVAEERGGRFPLDLTIYGPGLRSGLNLQRKIIKFGTYKNWRLNGEFIHNPSEDNERFNSLLPDDLALLEFSGSIIPDSAKLVLVGRGVPADSDLYKALNHYIGTAKMLQITHEELNRMINAISITIDHPVRQFVIDEVLEDAALGGVKGMQKLWSGVGRQRLSQEALQRARRNAEDIGRVGEELANIYLQHLMKNGKIQDYKWISQENAVAPYDFELKTGGEITLVDVKSTTGDFSRTIHISFNELRQMANGKEKYILYRLYDIEEEKAKIKIVENMKDYAVQVLTVLQNLPNGCMSDSVSVEPTSLPFGDELIIEVPAEEEFE